MTTYAATVEMIHQRRLAQCGITVRRLDEFHPTLEDRDGYVSSAFEWYETADRVTETRQYGALWRPIPVLPLEPTYTLLKAGLL